MDHSYTPAQTCKWIWYEATAADSENKYGRFIDYLSINQKEGLYTMRITADSQYALWINGTFVDFCQFSDLPHHKVYDVVDITDFLTEGRNKICFLVYYQGRSSSCYKQGRPGLLFDVISNDTIILESSEKTLSSEAPEYKNGPIEMITGQLGPTFEYDARLYDGWIQPEYDSTLWNTAYAEDYVSTLYPRNIKKLILEECTPSRLVAQGTFKFNENIPQNSTIAYKLQKAYLSSGISREFTNDKKTFTSRSKDDGIYLVYDILREECGYFTMDIKAPKGTKVYVAFGEHLEALRVSSYIGTRNFAFVYTCSGAENETFTHYFRRLGCRYLQLYVEGCDFTIENVGILPANYPVQDKGSFQTNDSLHNKIYQTSVRTLLLCMHEHYEDCPWREQSLYAMDSRNQMLCGYYVFGEYDFPRESLRLLGNGLRDDGLLELCSPGSVSVNIPYFSLMWVVELYEYFLFTGDIDFIHEMWPIAQKIIYTFWRKSKGKDLLCGWKGYWNFYEWAPGLENDASHWLATRDYNNSNNYDAPLSAFYFMALNAITELDKKLLPYSSEQYDYSQEAAWHQMLAESVKESFDDTFWDKDNKAYCTYIVNGEKAHYCELTNALALYCGLAREDHVSDCAKALTSLELIPVTLSHSIFKYEALMQLKGCYDKYVIDDITEKWGHMLYNNATTFWETIDGASAFDDAGSLCHGWSAIPLIIYFKYIAGIYPANIGFTDYICNSRKSIFTSFTATVPFGGRNSNAKILVCAKEDSCEVVVKK